jgi:putative ABC transport system permease protein
MNRALAFGVLPLTKDGSMSLFSIALRSIRQRGVASALTMFSMALGVMLVVAVLSIHGVVSQSFHNNSSLGYNMIVGPKGGKEQLVLNTVYYLSAPVENIPYTFYLEFLKRAERDRLLAQSFDAEATESVRDSLELVALADNAGVASVVQPLAAGRTAESLVPDVQEAKAPPAEFGRNGKYGQFTELAIPVCLGDYFHRFRVVGTTPTLFNDLVFDVENNRKFEFAQGRNFEWKSKENGFFEAVVGSTVAREMEVKLGDGINPAHGEPGGHVHQRKFIVVGILAPSGTPNDRAVFVNMEGFYLMEDHAKPLDEKALGEEQPQPAEEMTEQQWKEYLAAKAKREREQQLAKDPEPLPVEQREVTAILLRVPPMIAPAVENGINEGNQGQAVLPVAVIYKLFESFVNPIQWALLLLTAMICVVSGISILVSIYNSMSERRHEIAVIRALGAGRNTVMTIILLEATLLALGGGILGWLLGHAGVFACGPIIEDRTGVQVGFYDWEPAFRVLSWFGVTGAAAENFTLPVESVLLPALILLAILVGFWPAISAYRTDVARSLGK